MHSYFINLIIRELDIFKSKSKIIIISCELRRCTHVEQLLFCKMSISQFQTIFFSNVSAWYEIEQTEKYQKLMKL